MRLHECMIMQFNTKNKCYWCCAVIEVDIMKVQREYIGGNQDKWSDKMIFDWKNVMILYFFNDCIWFEQNLGAFIAKCPKSTCSVYNLLLSLGPSQPLRLMIKNGSWWIDVEPFCAGFHSWRQAHYSSNLARHGSFSQITNTVISLLIQAGPSFSNSVDCHKAVKHSVTLVRTSNDEKWQTGVESLFSLWCLNGTMPFPSLQFTQPSRTKLLN